VVSSRGSGRADGAESGELHRRSVTAVMEQPAGRPERDGGDGAPASAGIDRVPPGQPHDHPATWRRPPSSAGTQIYSVVARSLVPRAVQQQLMLLLLLLRRTTMDTHHTTPPPESMYRRRLRAYRITLEAKWHLSVLGADIVDVYPYKSFSNSDSPANIIDALWQLRNC